MMPVPKPIKKWLFCCVQRYSYFVGLGYQGKDIVFRFIKEYSSFRDFYRALGNNNNNNNRSIFI